MAKTFKSFIIHSLVPIIFLIIWSLMAVSIGNPIILPSISKVMVNFLHATDNFIGLGSIPRNIFVSLLRVLLGYSVGVIIALPLGIIMGYKDTVNSLFENFINLFRPVPPLAWVPLVLGWFGVSSLATVFGPKQGSMYT